MPILLKNKTSDSPGIILFNHNEVLFGVPAKFKKVNNFLLDLSKKKRVGIWCSHTGRFIMVWKMEAIRMARFFYVAKQK